MLYRISAGLLLLATLGHTFGGMLGTARRGPRAGAEADRGPRRAGRRHHMVPFLAGEWPVRQRGFSRPDRRALGAGRPRPHPSARHAPDQMGRTRQPRPHVTPWIQVLRPSRGSRIWTHRDLDGHRALCGLDVQAVGFDFVDERRARNPELERGARAVPTMMAQRALDVLPLHFGQRLRLIAAVRG